jgi:hypothetical protein
MAGYWSTSSVRYNLRKVSYPPAKPEAFGCELPSTRTYLVLFARSILNRYPPLLQLNFSKNSAIDRRYFGRGPAHRIRFRRWPPFIELVAHGINSTMQPAEPLVREVPLIGECTTLIILPNG